jgi:RNA polymerase sigma-70 factor (ECF subfamily)
MATLTTATTFDELYATYAPPLYAYLCNLDGCSNRADELAQEVFLRVHLTLRDNRLPEPPHQRPYLYRIARNLWIDTLRKDSRARTEMLPEPDAPHHPSVADTHADDLALAGGVAQALAQVPVRSREVLLLRVVDRLEYSEIATITDSTEGAVKMQVCRARAMFRRTLAQVTEGQG